MGKIFDALQKSHRTPKPKPIQEKLIHAKDSLESVSCSTNRDASLTRSSGKIVETKSEPTRLETREATTPDFKKIIPKSNLDKNLIAFHNPRSFEAEQFRMLRTNLLFPKTGRPSPRTILLTSALPGEGKSFVSANLAATIAQNVDKHVLLIDADMRHPTVHKIFGLGKVRGLSDYLNNGHTLPELLQRTYDRRLTILPGGPVPENPAELLSSRRMAALLREVRDRYDDRYIIIDSPPPQLTSESNALAQFVEGIIVVVKFGVTPRDLVSQLIDNFDESKLLGIVANGIEHRRRSYYGTDYYSKNRYFSSTKDN